MHCAQVSCFLSDWSCRSLLFSEDLGAAKGPCVASKESVSVHQKSCWKLREQTTGQITAQSSPPHPGLFLLFHSSSSLWGCREGGTVAFILSTAFLTASCWGPPVHRRKIRLWAPLESLTLRDNVLAFTFLHLFAKVCTSI